MHGSIASADFSPHRIQIQCPARRRRGARARREGVPRRIGHPVAGVIASRVRRAPARELVSARSGESIRRDLLLFEIVQPRHWTHRPTTTVGEIVDAVGPGGHRVWMYQDVFHLPGIHRRELRSAGINLILWSKGTGIGIPGI